MDTEGVDDMDAFEEIASLASLYVPEMPNKARSLFAADVPRLDLWYDFGLFLHQSWQRGVDN